MSNAASPNPSATDWARVSDLPDDAIDTSDIPEWTEDDFARATLMAGGKRIDPDALVLLETDRELARWFSSAGEGVRREARDALHQIMTRHQT